MILYQTTRINKSISHLVSGFKILFEGYTRHDNHGFMVTKRSSFLLQFLGIQSYHIYVHINQDPPPNRKVN
jgi:hypothetical protein